LKIHLDDRRGYSNDTVAIVNESEVSQKRER